MQSMEERICIEITMSLQSLEKFIERADNLYSLSYIILTIAKVGLLNQIFSEVIIPHMGAACEKCMKMFDSQQEKPPVKSDREFDRAESDRRLSRKVISKEDKAQSVCGKGSNIEIQSNSSVRETKIFMKSKSTALFSADGDRRHSSILQFTLDHESIIIKGNSDSQPGGPSPEQYYTLIDKIAFVRKTMDCIRVTSPDGQSQLHCPPQYLFSTLTVSEGRPVESIEQVAPNKVIQVNDSPIKVNLKLKCKNCKKQLKITFCKGVMSLNNIECPGCESKDKWSISDIVSSAPVWGDGVKIDNHQQLQDAPSILRVMGCVVCLKFSNCDKMKCGCYLCKSCINTNQDLSLDLQCRMCEGSYIL